MYINNIISNCEECGHYSVGLGGEYCDKVGGKMRWYGICSEAIYEPKHIRKIKSKAKRSTKMERDKKYKEHLKFISSNGYAATLVNKKYVKSDSGGKIIYLPFECSYYKRIPSSIRHKSDEKYSNKYIRRYKGEIKDGSSYKKYCVISR